MLAIEMEMPERCLDCQLNQSDMKCAVNGNTTGDNRFELIGEFKGKLVEGTNIETSPEEMAVLDNIFFRFWQMGWLDKLKAQEQKCRECGEATSKAIQELQAKLKAQEIGKVNITITQSDGWKEGNCPFCGMKVDSFYNWSFCGTCGKGLKWDA